MTKPTIAVLGAGLLGSCVALDLARRGFGTRLLERLDGPMLGASLRNEGKVHLGFVYALDPVGTTRRRMLEGALAFAPLLDELCGPMPWEAWRTEGFRYAVMPDSMVAPEHLEASYEHLRRLLPESLAAAPRPAHYLGLEPEWLWRRSMEARGRPRVDGRLVERCFETEEVSVDPGCLSRAIANRLRHEPRVGLRCGVLVKGAQRCAGGFRLDLETARGSEELRVDGVVNCTWGDRVRIDRTLGLEGDDAAYNYRVKYQVLVRPPRIGPELAPVTMVQGPFGDLVPWRDGRVYLSWYPEGRTYFGASPPAPPRDPELEASRVAKRSLEVMTDLFPGLAGSEILSSLPGLILARGATDVDDRASALHRREDMGAESHDGWWTVDAGKLTTAPLVAYRAVLGIEQEVGVGVA